MKRDIVLSVRYILVAVLVFFIVFFAFSESSNSNKSSIGASRLPTMEVVISDSDVLEDCKVYIEKQEVSNGYYVKQGWCQAWVKGPYLYSIEGLETHFCITAHSKIYLDSFKSRVFCSPHTCGEIKPVSTSSGKVLTYSSVGACRGGLTGNSKVRIYFYVKYVYEEKWWCSQYSGRCIVDITLYPRAIYEISDIKEPVQPYQPPSRPWHALGPYAGHSIILFNKEFHGVFELGVPPEVIRDYFESLPHCIVDSYVKVIDLSGRGPGWYYWWYKDDDPFTYEVMFGIE